MNKSIDIIVNNTDNFKACNRSGYPKYYVVVTDVFGEECCIFMHYSKLEYYRRMLWTENVVGISFTSLHRSFNCGTRRVPQIMEVFGRVRNTPKSRLKKIKEQYPEHFI